MIASIAESFVSHLVPQKRLVWFKSSAHFPTRRSPEAFRTPWRSCAKRRHG
jgi:hypothetical protein